MGGTLVLAGIGACFSGGSAGSGTADGGAGGPSGVAGASGGADSATADSATADSATADSATADSAATTLMIEQHGVTWLFSHPVQYGQFINGDYWVIDSGSGVVIESVSPTTVDGRNGSMKNPVPHGSQGLDSGARHFSSAEQLSFPHTFYAGDSLLSSITRAPEDTQDLAGSGLGSHHFIKTVAILSVLNVAPPEGSFRPGYCDREQNLYSFDQIDKSILPSLPSPIPPNVPSYYARLVQRPWIVFVTDWSGRSNHPYDNMPGYHRVVGKALSQVAMFLVTDSADKTETLRGFVQVGIDYFYSEAADSSTWQWPVVFAGLLLQEPDIYNYWIDRPDKIRNSREGDKLYYLEDVVTSASSIVPQGRTWVEWKTSDGKYVGFRKQVGQEHEHLHPSEWSATLRKNETYRANLDVDPWIGMHLSSMLVDVNSSIDVRSLFGNNAAWDYSDRWMTDGFTTNMYGDGDQTYYEVVGAPYSNSYGSSGFSWIDAMWEAYRQ